MNTCVFCNIIEGAIPCQMVWEDSNMMAFLDINPVSQGHTLLIPKTHHENIVTAPEELVRDMFAQARFLIPKIKTATKADYVVLSVVGIDVPHLHIHLIPRHKNDGLQNFWPTHSYKEGEIEKIRAEILEAINL